jgi:hypothetical protein
MWTPEVGVNHQLGTCNCCGGTHPPDPARPVEARSGASRVWALDADEMKINRAGPDLCYITRMHYERSHGWWVRVPRAPSKLFSDGKHGGMRRALQTAIEFRDR